MSLAHWAPPLAAQRRPPAAGNRPTDPWFPDASGYHVGGSDASGIVWKVGSSVQDLAVGDELDEQVNPCLSHTYRFDEIPEVHQLMLRNKHPSGNLACLVNARA